MREKDITYTIRRATEDDIPLIHSLAWRIFPETYKAILSAGQTDYMMEQMYSPVSLHEQMTRGGHVYLLAYAGKRCTGYVSVRPAGQSLFHLEKIYVLPETQGTGCGRFLFNSVIDYVRSVHAGPFSIELNVNRHNVAVGFYRHMGMTIDRRGDFPIGNGYYMNDYIMKLNVGSV